MTPKRERRGMKTRLALLEDQKRKTSNTRHAYCRKHTYQNHPYVDPRSTPFLFPIPKSR